MPVFQEKHEELKHFETMIGVPSGRLAVTMDMITDAMASSASTEFTAKPAPARTTSPGQPNRNEEPERRQRIDPECNGRVEESAASL